MSTPTSLFRASTHNPPKFLITSYRAWHSPTHGGRNNSRCLATVHSVPKSLPEVWFTGSVPRRVLPANNQNQPHDERTVKLGKSTQAPPSSLKKSLTQIAALRILQERLPSLLQSPLPQEILSPQIKLHLFPSTHPHLPTVTGRVAYSAALWTSPIAWGRVPLVGNVKLSILSERMLNRTPNNEQLIVRWQTIGKTRGKGTGAFYKGIGASDNVDKITEWLGGGKGEDDSKEFTGLFIFEFDEEGRVVSHTIEHVQEGGNWEKGVGAKVVGLTDWLLGGMKRNGEEGGAPCPACFEERGRGRR
ncbi:hypothetical protein B7494_g570 [Chlorociboria aeruginascens]|nr:hypothetical protein B7494_g570 [Chlorociboria aeruginascens]